MRSASNSAHLLEPHFDGLLTPEDAAFKHSLQSWMDSFPPEARKSASFGLLKSTIRDKFGGMKIAE